MPNGGSLTLRRLAVWIFDPLLRMKTLAALVDICHGEWQRYWTHMTWAYLPCSYTQTMPLDTSNRDTASHVHRITSSHLGVPMLPRPRIVKKLLNFYIKIMLKFLIFG